jgi:hypothetical protein
MEVVPDSYFFYSKASKKFHLLLSISSEKEQFNQGLHYNTWLTFSDRKYLGYLSAYLQTLLKLVFHILREG